MKVKAIPSIGGMAILLFLLACSSGPRQTAVEVSYDEFTSQKNITRQVEVAPGDILTLSLGSNASTGFRWQESAQISDQTILQQTEHKYVAPEAKNGATLAPGTPGKQV